MEDVLGVVITVVLLFLFFLPLGLGIVHLYRLVNPYAPGRRSTARELLGCLGWFGFFALIVALLLPARCTSSEAARRSQCNNNLKQIVLAMHNYADKYGCLPPAYTVDKAGRPLHSWRVLLLPHLEQRALYNCLRLDEPFDSPHNQAIFQSTESGDARRTPGAFLCPSDRGNRTETNYVMVLSPRTISNGPNSVRFKDITDGTSNTIAVVDTYDLGIRWYEPRDLRVEEMSFKINDPEYFGIASRHLGGANVALADGSVRFLPDDTDPRMIEAMTTISGGEDVRAVLR
jgi:prepilin-type processing-associated H-X9-DG protein